MCVKLFVYTKAFKATIFAAVLSEPWLIGIRWIYEGLNVGTPAKDLYFCPDRVVKETGYSFKDRPYGQEAFK